MHRVSAARLSKEASVLYRDISPTRIIDAGNVKVMEKVINGQRNQNNLQSPPEQDEYAYELKQAEFAAAANVSGELDSRPLDQPRRSSVDAGQRERAVFLCPDSAPTSSRGGPTSQSPSKGLHEMSTTSVRNSMLKLAPRNPNPAPGRDGATSGGGGRNRLPNANLSISVPRKGTPVASRREKPEIEDIDQIPDNKVNELKLFRGAAAAKQKVSSKDIGTTAAYT